MSKTVTTIIKSGDYQTHSEIPPKKATPPPPPPAPKGNDKQK